MNDKINEWDFWNLTAIFTLKEKRNRMCGCSHGNFALKRLFL